MADHTHDEHSHGGAALYLFVFVLLCMLTTGSFLTFFDFWNTHIPKNVSRAFMMAISCAKAMLVILFFMHLKWEANWKYVLTIPAAMMSVFLVLMLVPDVGCRYNHYTEERLQRAAEAVEHHDVAAVGSDHAVEHAGEATPH
jgi:cytochrome c oxidase subunit 4